MVAALKRDGAPTRADFHAAIAARSDRWYAACLAITRNAALAEDAVQDALLSAWAKRNQFRDNARLDTWIHRIAINAALQLVRKSKPCVFAALDDDIPDPAPAPDALTADAELGAELQQALVRLSDVERVCFVLKHLEQWRLQEIADEIGSGIGTVKQALFRGVRKLRPLMHGLQGETA